MDWKTRSNNEELRRYTYQYDDLNRLTKSFYSKPLAVQPNTGSYDEYLSYDVNGNIKTLSRFGDMDKPQAVKIDELSYTYIGNQLVKVSDNSQNPSGYPIGGRVIPYDENGNMMNHNDKGISYIGYNHLNLPSAVFWNGKQTFYLYRADGVKVKKDFPGKVTDYLDGFQYENGALQFVPTAEGYYDFVKQRYVYNYTDHLGNVRLSYAKNNNAALEILEENNYYAFGLKHKGYGGVNLGNPNYHYKYNGKELQENSMYDYGARLYMPEIGRWNAVDPLAEKYPNISPYIYVANNPVKFVDFDGRDFGIRINHENKTIIIEANYYYQNENTYINNIPSLDYWNALKGKYTTKDGIVYSVSFSLKGNVIEDRQRVRDVASKDPIGNSVQELSDEGYSNLVKSWLEADQERLGNQLENGGGVTRKKKEIVNKLSVANSYTRAHEIGHTLGLDEEVGGVMNYSSSFNSMSAPNQINLKEVLRNGINKIADKNTLNTPGAKTIKNGYPNIQVIVEGNYDGKKGFGNIKKIE